MKLVARALACAIVLAGAGAAFAQGQTINEYVRFLVAENADDGEHLVGSIELRELEAGEDSEIVFHLDLEKTYFIYGACDDDCGDIDLAAEDGNGDWVDSDDENDDSPVLMILAGEAGEQLSVTAHMAACEVDVCVAGVGLYEAGY